MTGKQAQPFSPPLPGMKIPLHSKDALVLVRASELQEYYRQGFEAGKNSSSQPKDDGKIVHTIPTPEYIDPHYRSFLRTRSRTN